MQVFYMWNDKPELIACSTAGKGATTIKERLSA